jgi:predicted transposase YbfD/YdcC
LPAQSGMFAVLSSAAATSCELQVDPADCGRLLELLALVPDPRKRRGIRHSVAAVIAIAAAAVLAGSTSVLAIGEWAAEAPHGVLGALGSRRSPRTGRFTAPHGDTFRRVLREVDANAVDTMIGAFLAERVGLGSPPAPDDAGRPDHRTADPSQDRSGRSDNPRDEPIVGALSVDGKAVRGARREDGRAVHLLAATVHGVPTVLAQRDVAHKTNEITQVKPLLAPLNLTGWAVTLDALHCQRETARYLVEDKNAAYVFTAAKDNQPKLVAALDALPWTTVPITHTTHDRGHGRDERRTIQVMPAPEGIFPYAKQVFLVERYVADLAGTPRSAVAALGLTCLSAAQAGPERLATLVRGHWGIEALHWIRDVTFNEDRSQLRNGSAPQILAGLRNLAVGVLHASGRTKIASSLRWVSRDPTRALDILARPA